MQWLKSEYLLGFVFFIYIGLFSTAAWNQAPNIDEPAHIAAGLYSWDTGRFDMYRVNPPLPRMLATSFVNLSRDWTTFYPELNSRQEFSQGQKLLSVNGFRRCRINFWIARMTMLPIGCLGLLLIFRYTKQLFGEGNAYLASGLYCVCPNHLSSAVSFSTDLSAAVISLALSMAFGNLLAKISHKSILLLGFLLGIGCLVKFSMLLWYVIIPIGLVWSQFRATDRSNWKRIAVAIASIFVTSFVVINLGYLFEDSFVRFRELNLRSSVFLAIGEILSRICVPIEIQFVPLPANFLKGIDEQLCDVRLFSSTQMREGITLFWYTFQAILKLPLLVWIIIGVLIFERTRQPDFQQSTALTLPLVSMLVLLSMMSGGIVHFRYLLPSISLFYVWLCRVRFELFSIRKTILIGIGLLEIIAWIPHPHSYMSPILGGGAFGAYYLRDSQFDWGQDAYRMHDWIQSNYPKSRVILNIVTPLDVRDFDSVRYLSISMTGMPPCDFEGLIAVSRSRYSHGNALQSCFDFRLEKLETIGHTIDIYLAKKPEE